MLFPIVFGVIVVFAIMLLVTMKKQKKSSVETVAAPSIHEEIAKTVEEAKNLAPVEEAPKMKAEPKKISKPAPPKAKDDSKSTKPQVKKAPKKKVDVQIG